MLPWELPRLVLSVSSSPSTLFSRARTSPRSLSRTRTRTLKNTNAHTHVHLAGNRSLPTDNVLLFHSLSTNALTWQLGKHPAIVTHEHARDQHTPTHQAHTHQHTQLRKYPANATHEHARARTHYDTHQYTHHHAQLGGQAAHIYPRTSFRPWRGTCAVVASEFVREFVICWSYVPTNSVALPMRFIRRGQVPQRQGEERRGREETGGGEGRERGHRRS